MTDTLGFTGTRHGMTEEQKVTVDDLLSKVGTVHHGDCVGADADFHALADAHGHLIIIHPPVDTKLRAYCDGIEIRPPKMYHDRNRDIVDESDRLVATPAEGFEQRVGGTWNTVRYARQQGKPVLIVWPDGSTVESGGKPMIEKEG